MTTDHLTPEVMTQHVLDLGKAFKVKVTFGEKLAPDQARAGYRELVKRNRHTGETFKVIQKAVQFPTITCEEQYAVALHELGHCIDPMGMLHHHYSQQARALFHIFGYSVFNKADWRLKLTEERAAWKWAEHYALVWTERMANVRKMTYATYKRNAKHIGAI